MTRFNRGRPGSVPIGLAAGALVAAAVGLAVETPAQSQYMDVEDVKPGMKGYGLTVMSGTEPVKFDIEVISTLHNFRPGQDLILIKTPHPRLEVARTVAGMSGSPIFIDGKMIGAYAYGWMFNVEPIAGVTPIENMLADLKRPVPKELLPGLSRRPLPGGKTAQKAKKAPSKQRYAGEPLDYDLRTHAAQVASRTSPALRAPTGTGLRAASTDVMVGGLGGSSFQLAEDLLRPLGMNLMQTGGGGTSKAIPADAPTKYVDGGAITVQLVRGDISMSGLGTVTNVVGDKLIAFGHPMVNGGIEALPTAIGHVHWILATQNRSFKIGEPLRPLGTLVNDRQASIVIDTTIEAPVFPVSVDVDGSLGAPKTRWDMEIAHDPFFAPSFVAVGIGSALETTTGERNDMTYRAVSKLTIAGHGTLEFEDFGAGSGSPIGPPDVARSRLVRALGTLFNNPWEEPHIESIETRVQVEHTRKVSLLRGAQVLESEVDPGEPARVRLTFIPWGEQKKVTQTVEIPLDASLAGQTVTIRLQPGYSVQRLVAPPESFGDLLDVLTKMDFPPQSMVATYNLPEEATAAFEGQVASRLPPYAANLLLPETQSASPLVYKAQKQVVIPTPRYVVGTDNIQVKIREVVR